nr:hypothetical protein Iba_chr14bCG12970 [Ipomoea batatas]GME11473.1 hypothetical protein Iba_scaffold11673CG0020 [Ipomoea batatas]
MPAPPKPILNKLVPFARMVTSSSRTVLAKLLRFLPPKQGSMDMPSVILLQLIFSLARSLRILSHHLITVMFLMLTVLTIS